MLRPDFISSVKIQTKDSDMKHFVQKQNIWLIIFLFTLTVSWTLPQKALAADGKEIGMWAGAGFCSLIYTPAKAATFLALGIAGGLSGLVTVPLGESNISEDIIKMGFYGDWLIRPDHLLGEDYPHIISFDEEIRFL